MDVRKALEAGHAALAAAKAASEATKVGVPRIGSIGAVIGDRVYGVCSRKALLRRLGKETPADLSTDLMWKFGEANEGHWERILTAAGVPFSRDTKVSLTIDNQVVEGHPDIVVLDQPGGVPVRLLELKGVFSFNTANTILKGHPKNENLIQAAAYARVLGVPGSLCYTSASYIATPGWAMKEHGKTIRPFYLIYDLEWRGDDLWYRREGADWQQSLITWPAIQDYYRLVAEMDAEKTLGPRASADYLDGEPHKFGDAADCKYCDFAQACDRYDMNRDFNEWLQVATKGE